MQTFLEVKYGNYAKLLEFNIFLFEESQQVLGYGSVMWLQQTDNLFCNENRNI